MTYTKNTWLARIGTGLNKFKNTGTATDLVLTPDPDTITQAGTPFSAAWLNNIEAGVAQAQVLEFAGTPTGTAATGQLALDTSSGAVYYYLNGWVAFAKAYTATFSSSGWSTNADGYYTQTQTVSGLKASYPVDPLVDVALLGDDAAADLVLIEAWANVGLVTTGANSLTALCPAAAPTVNLPVVVVVLL